MPREEVVPSDLANFNRQEFLDKRVSDKKIQDDANSAIDNLQNTMIEVEIGRFLAETKTSTSTTTSTSTPPRSISQNVLLEQERVEIVSRVQNNLLEVQEDELEEMLELNGKVLYGRNVTSQEGGRSWLDALALNFFSDNAFEREKDPSERIYISNLIRNAVLNSLDSPGLAFFRAWMPEDQVRLLHDDSEHRPPLYLFWVVASALQRNITIWVAPPPPRDLLSSSSTTFDEEAMSLSLNGEEEEKKSSQQLPMQFHPFTEQGRIEAAKNEPISLGYIPNTRFYAVRKNIGERPRDTETEISQQKSKSGSNSGIYRTSFDDDSSLANNQLLMALFKILRQFNKYFHDNLESSKSFSLDFAPDNALYDRLIRVLIKVIEHEVVAYKQGIDLNKVPEMNIHQRPFFYNGAVLRVILDTLIGDNILEYLAMSPEWAKWLVDYGDQLLHAVSSSYLCADWVLYPLESDQHQQPWLMWFQGSSWPWKYGKHYSYSIDSLKSFSDGNKDVLPLNPPPSHLAYNFCLFCMRACVNRSLDYLCWRSGQ